jgi:hypothetical protein
VANAVIGLGLLLRGRSAVFACLVLAAVQLIKGVVDALPIVRHTSSVFDFVLPGLVIAAAIWSAMYLPPLMSARRHWAAFR